MVGYPKYGAMVDWALVVPVAGLVSCVLRTRAHRSLLGSVVVLAQATAVMLFIFLAHRTGRHVAAGVAIAAWVWTLVRVNRGGANEASFLKVVEALSPVSYILAYPLFFTGNNALERGVGAAILVIHAVTIPSIVILVWAEELHERWGCYGSQATIYDYDKVRRAYSLLPLPLQNKRVLTPGPTCRECAECGISTRCRSVATSSRRRAATVPRSTSTAPRTRCRGSSSAK